MAPARKLFPIGLYASLLAALLALLRPSAVAPAERMFGAVAALPFRAFGGLVAKPAEAASAPRGEVRAHEFWSRVVAAERRRRPAQIPSELAPVLCAVRGFRARERRLVLDRRWQAVDVCARYATIGDALVGFLAPRQGDRDWVEVQLFGGADSTRRVPAELDSERGAVRFVVEAASPIDPWPLRATLIDDPYRAARLESDAYGVVTASFPGDPLGAIPPGLRIGDLRIWGYQRDGRRLPIGFFVDPVRVHAASVVTLWRPAGAEVPRDAASGWIRHRIQAFALTSYGARVFASLPFGLGAVPAGAPVARGERLVGTVASSGPGYAFVRPFGVVGSRWEVMFMPDQREPRPLAVVIVRADDARVTARIASGDDVLAAGALFTSSVHGLAGLWIGDVVPGDAAREIVIERPRPASAGGLEVLLRAAAEVNS